MKIFGSVFLWMIVLTAFSSHSYSQFVGGVGSTWNNPVSAHLSRAAWNSITQRTALVARLKRMGCTEAQIKQIGGGIDGLNKAIAKRSCTGRAAAQNAQTRSRTTSASTTRSTTPAKPATPSASVYSTTFKQTGTRIAMPQLVAQITPNDKALQQKQVAFLEAEISEYEKQQRARGYGDDAAAAMAFFASIAIHLQDPRIAINKKGVDSLTDALRGAFGEKLASVSDKDKQQLYENLLTLGMVIAARAENADEKTLAELKQLSESLCDQYLKLDVTKFRFDDNGLMEVTSGNNAPTPSRKAVSS